MRAHNPIPNLDLTPPYPCLGGGFVCPAGRKPVGIQVGVWVGKPVGFRSNFAACRSTSASTRMLPASQTAYRPHPHVLNCVQYAAAVHVLYIRRYAAACPPVPMSTASPSAGSPSTSAHPCPSLPANDRTTLDASVISTSTSTTSRPYCSRWIAQNVCQQSDSPRIHGLPIYMDAQCDITTPKKMQKT